MPGTPNAPPVTPPSRVGAEPPRVLMVDDDPHVRMVARLMLERGGFAVEEAADATAAEDRIRTADRPFAVVVLDVTLPDRSGTELVPVFRALAPGLRLVLASGLAEDDVPGHGADGYLHKPFTREQLLAAVRGVPGAS